MMMGYIGSDAKRDEMQRRFHRLSLHDDVDVVSRSPSMWCTDGETTQPSPFHQPSKSAEHLTYVSDDQGCQPGTPLQSNEIFNEKLMRLVGDIYTQDQDGDTYLHQCIIHNKPELIEGVLKVTIATDMLRLINLQNHKFQTPLHLAVILNMPGVALVLLQCGANPDIQDEELNTALHIACEYGYEEVVKVLTSFEHDSTIVNCQGFTSLYAAGEKVNLGIVQQLVECGHNINTQEIIGGKTLLHFAIENDAEDLLSYLLSNPYTQTASEDKYRRKAITLIEANEQSHNIVKENWPALIALVKQMDGLK